MTDTRAQPCAMSARRSARLEIIRGVNLDIAKGERHAIIGPNGAGKTTLFNLISGRFLVSSGEIRLNGERIDRLPPHKINRMGLSRSFQITSIFHRLSVFENLRCALLWSMGYRYSFWTPLWLQRELNERTDEMLEDLNLTARRDTAAGLLSYADQRALEIGMTIAGGASVILLDEPTAGMSNTETDNAVELIRRVSKGKTLLMVEHDMKVVFDLADVITVLVYGQVIASGPPQEVRANPAVQEAYLGRAGRRMILEVSNLHAYYGQSHILHGVDMNVNDGEIVSLLGRNGVGRSTACKAIMGLVAAQGTVKFRDRDIAGLRPDQVAHCGIGYVPEDRQIFPTLTVRQNLELGLKRSDKFGRWNFDDVFRLFPNLGGPAGCLRRRAVGRRAADADDVPHADGRSRPDPDRRADRGAGAQAGRAGRRTAGRDRPARGCHPAGRAETGDRAEDLRAALRHGPWPNRFSRHAGGARRQIPPSAGNGWRFKAPRLRPVDLSRLLHN